MRKARLSLVVFSAIGLTASAAWGQAQPPQHPLPQSPRPRLPLRPRPRRHPRRHPRPRPRPSRRCRRRPLPVRRPRPCPPRRPIHRAHQPRLMREKGIITQAEYESAIHDLSETSGSAQETRARSSWASGRRRSTASSRPTTSTTRRGLHRPRRRRARRAPLARQQRGRQRANDRWASATPASGSA